MRARAVSDPLTSTTTMRYLFRFLLLAFALVQGAHGQATAADKPQTILGPGDVIRVTVYQNPDLTTEARISELGQINFPLIGSVNVGNATVSAAEQRIAKMLRDGNFVLRPQVTVNVLQI